MSDDARPVYLAGMTAEQAAQLAAVNAPGLAALRRYLDAGEAVAFLGAGVSVPLYPLWSAMIGELVHAAAARGLAEDTAATIRAVAGEQPDAAVELVRRHLGAAQYREALREVFRVRRDPVSGRTWTPVHELVCRSPFRAVVTTNYDPGIVDARMRVRPGASGTRISPVGLRSLNTMPLGAEPPIFFTISSSPSGVPRLPGESPMANLEVEIG